jgi:hypothetical protein
VEGFVPISYVREYHAGLLKEDSDKEKAENNKYRYHLIFGFLVWIESVQLILYRN